MAAAKRLLGLLGLFLAAFPHVALAAPDAAAAPNAARQQRPAATNAAARPAPPALPEPWGLCGAAIAAAEREAGMPAGLLGAVAKVETGRRAPDGSVQPWPWSYNAAGDGRYAASNAEALQEVRARGARITWFHPTRQDPVATALQRARGCIERFVPLASLADLVAARTLLR
jgi:hypothetical protein